MIIVIPCIITMVVTARPLPIVLLFRQLIEKDPYIEEVLNELERISNDPKRRAEYEAREDALRDYFYSGNYGRIIKIIESKGDS